MLLKLISLLALSAFSFHGLDQPSMTAMAEVIPEGEADMMVNLRRSVSLVVLFFFLFFFLSSPHLLYLFLFFFFFFFFFFLPWWPCLSCLFGPQCCCMILCVYSFVLVMYFPSLPHILPFLSPTVPLGVCICFCFFI